MAEDVKYLAAAGEVMNYVRSGAGTVLMAGLYILGYTACILFPPPSGPSIILTWRLPLPALLHVSNPAHPDVLR